MEALRMLFGKKHREAKVKAFCTVVYPVISDCATVWIPWQKASVDRLNRIPREFVVEIVLQDLSAEDFCSRTKILPVEKLKERSRLVLLYKKAKNIYPGFSQVLKRCIPFHPQPSINLLSPSAIAVRL